MGDSSHPHPPAPANLLYRDPPGESRESSEQLLKQLRSRKNSLRKIALTLPSTAATTSCCRSSSSTSSTATQRRNAAAASSSATPAIVLSPTDGAGGSTTTATTVPSTATGLARVVSASDDAVIVDSLTAATINLQLPHRQPSSSEDTEEDEDAEAAELATATVGSVGGSVAGGGGEGSVASESRELSPITGPTSRLLESIASTDDEEGAAAAAGYAGGGADHPPANESPHQRRKRSPSLAWERLAMSLRQTDTKPRGGFFLESWSDSGSAVDTQNVVQVLLEEARKSGKYVQFRPSMEVAISSCAEAETVDAVRILHSVLGLRDDFVADWPVLNSLAVRARKSDEMATTTQPVFDPGLVEPLPPCKAVARWEQGILTVYWKPPEATAAPALPETPCFDGQPLLNWSNPVPTVSRFLSALKQVMAAVQHPACKSFAFRRLEFLKSKYYTHRMFNGSAELAETKANKHRDFYNVRKVDTHVHHSACMHQKHLLRFIRKKYRTEPDEIVARSSDGSPVTLAEIFEKEVGVPARDASLDLLNVHALGSCFQRFDIFNSKYNPFGQALLREVFLKTDNIMGGRYLGELTQEVESDLIDGKYQFVEWRLSIYGRRRDEWQRLASWLKRHKLSCQQVRWMIQVPRLFHVYRKLGLVASFGELLKNVFEPLFEAVRDPRSYPEVFEMLLQLNGWDSVDDESVVSKYTSEGGALPLPDDWVEPSNPPYSYWAYYMYANIRALNHLLIARGLRHLPFRPHCGEAGSVSHLASAFLLADAINHGIMLKKAPVLQYLFYLRHIGLAMSPLSNNALFHDMAKNPFAQFFAVGLNVSLSTDDPMMFHFTSEPLLEEYSCCAHTWKLSPVDLCELAKNSVLQSHFEPQLKKHWISDDYHKPGAAGNDILKTNVSNIRVQYREDTLKEELMFLRDVLRIQDIVTGFQPL